LSIQQPWAWAILHAGKDCENRTWRSSFRGPLLIHASKTISPGGYLAVKDLCPGVPAVEELPRGGIVGQARLVDVVQDYSSPWAEPGGYHWILVDVCCLPFFPCLGRQGLFDVVYPAGSEPSPQLGLFSDRSLPETGQGEFIRVWSESMGCWLERPPAPETPRRGLYGHDDLEVLEWLRTTALSAGRLVIGSTALVRIEVSDASAWAAETLARIDGESPAVRRVWLRVARAMREAVSASKK